MNNVFPDKPTENNQYMIKRIKNYVSEKPKLFVGMVLLLLVGLPVLAYLSSHGQNLISYAAGAAHIELEVGTTTGNVTIVNDANASGGKYVKFGTASSSAQQSSISQYGITWTFDKAYPAGQFANGDWWVVGPVTITSITPDFDGSRNGWEVNPNDPVKQGFESREPDFDTTKIPVLPYTAQPNQSIVKGISAIDGPAGGCADASHACFLDTAAVLTVLGQIPPDNGTTVFRPPYAGTQKPLYSVNSLRADLLPSLNPAATSSAGAPTLAWVQSRFQRVQLDHKTPYYGSWLHPKQNLPVYGGDVAVDIINGGLRLMLNESFATKKPALIAYVQQGIDMYGMVKMGTKWQWTSNGGWGVGRKLPIVFAAVLLNDQTMQNDIKNVSANLVTSPFIEDGETYFGQNGVALWGWYAATEKQYWDKIRTGNGARDSADPYHYVDGGGTEIGAAYQFCCTTQPYKGEALISMLLPGARTVWNHEAFYSYVDRWVTKGVWALPDPCGLTDPGPNYTGNCVASSSGRFADKHGATPDGGNYGSTFVNNMWKAYRSTAP